MHKNQLLVEHQPGPQPVEAAALATYAAVQEGTFAGLPAAPQPAEALPQPHAKIGSKRWIGRRVVALTATLFIGAAGGTSYNAVQPDELGETYQYSFSELHPEQPLLPDNLEAAPGVDAADVSLTEFLLSQPEEHDITNEFHQIDQLAQTHAEENLNVIATTVDAQIRQKVAAKYDLTVFDPTPIVRALHADLDKKSAERPLSIEDYIKLANSYLANFDISIEIEAPGTAYSYDLHAPTMEELQKQITVKYSILSMVQAVSREPREYTDQLGIKRFLLAMESPGKSSKTAAYVRLDKESPYFNSAIFNLRYYIGESVVFHEQWHHADYNLSGGLDSMYDDTPFESFNEGATYGKNEQTHLLAASEQGFLTLNQYYSLQSKLYKQIQQYAGKPGCEQIGRGLELQLQAAGARTVFISDYAGAANVGEHKAETGALIPQGDRYDVALDPWLPAIREQIKMELARLGHVLPGVARYFIALSERPTASPTRFQDQCEQPQIKGGPTGQK